MGGRGRSFAFIELNIIVLMAGPLLSTLLVELWYNCAAGEVGEFFFCFGICSVDNNLGEPIYPYLSFNKDLSAFLEQNRICSKMNHDKAKTHLVGK